MLLTPGRVQSQSGDKEDDREGYDSDQGVHSKPSDLLQYPGNKA